MTRAEIEGLIAKAKAHWLWPDTPPPLDDASELALWIEGVRSVAFLAGARHSEITDVEAHVLATALRAMLAESEAMRACMDWCRRQADEIMAVSAGCATTDGDPGGGLEWCNRLASDIAANLAQGAPDHA